MRPIKINCSCLVVGVLLCPQVFLIETNQINLFPTRQVYVQSVSFCLLVCHHTTRNKMSAGLTVLALFRYYFVWGLYTGQRIRWARRCTWWALWPALVTANELTKFSATIMLLFFKGIGLLELDNPSHDISSISAFLDSLKYYTRLTLFVSILANFSQKFVNNSFSIYYGRRQYAILTNQVYRLVDHRAIVAVAFVLGIFVFDLINAIFHYRYVGLFNFLNCLTMTIISGSTFWLTIYFLGVNICLFHKLKTLAGHCDRLCPLMEHFNVARIAAQNADRFYDLYGGPLIIIVAHYFIKFLFALFVVVFQGRNLVFLPNLWPDFGIISIRLVLLYFLAELLKQSAHSFYRIANRQFNSLARDKKCSHKFYQKALIARLLHQEDYRLVVPVCLGHLSHLDLVNFVSSCLYFFDLSIVLYSTEFM